MASAAIQRILDAGRAAHPEVTASVHDVAPLLARRLTDETQPDHLDAGELYLAAACAAGDAAAIAAFERRYFGAIPAALSRLALGRDEIAEIEQTLRVRLFVSEGGAEPKVLAYAGQGQLGGLLRVAALRAGLNVLRDRGKIARGSDDDGLDDIPVANDDPELVRLKSQHRHAFKAAFEAAIRSLEPRDRTLLDLALVKGLGIDRIGAIYGVHRATAARWVQSARASLAKAVHKILGEQLGARGSELDNVRMLVESQLELSLERLLRSRPI